MGEFSIDRTRASRLDGVRVSAGWETTTGLPTVVDLETGSITRLPWQRRDDRLALDDGIVWLVRVGQGREAPAAGHYRPRAQGAEIAGQPDERKVNWTKFGHSLGAKFSIPKLTSPNGQILPLSDPLAGSLAHHFT